MTARRRPPLTSTPVGGSCRSLRLPGGSPEPSNHRPLPPVPKLLLHPFSTGALLALLVQIARQPLPAVMANGIEAVVSPAAWGPAAAISADAPHGRPGSGKGMAWQEFQKR